MKIKSMGWFLIGIALLLVIVLSIIKIDVDQEQSFLCKLIDESPTLMMENCPAHQNNISWLILLGLLVTIFILGSGIYLLLFSTKESPAPKSEIKTTQKIEVTKLPEEERKIYELVKLNLGSLYQSDIIKHTGLSKVKVSRILDRLEGKGIIDRKRRGMTNIVILK